MFKVQIIKTNLQFWIYISRANYYFFPFKVLNLIESTTFSLLKKYGKWFLSEHYFNLLTFCKNANSYFHLSTDLIYSSNIQSPEKLFLTPKNLKVYSINLAFSRRFFQIKTSFLTCSCLCLVALWLIRPSQCLLK